MRFKAVPTTVAPSVTPRCSIGGSAILPAGLEVPDCRNCGAKLLLFLQYDIDASWSLPFEAGSRLVVFMCPKCNEIPSFNPFPGGALPADFWLSAEGHFFAAMCKPADEEVILPQKPLLVTKELHFEPTAEEGHMPGSVCVGGSPFWLQDPERFVCRCGSELAFVSQVAENFGFEKQADAPAQPNSFSADEYCLFLGNEVYVFACPRQCDPRAVWITVQG